MSTLAPTWKPPLTHLVDESSDWTRTLCGVAIDREWQSSDPVDDLYIEEEIACGCLRCRRASLVILRKQEADKCPAS